MDIRGIILEALILYDKGENFADRIIKNTLDKYSYLHKYERSFISRAFTGTIERKLTLDHIIDSFSTVKVNKQKPVIRNILRMSVYQLVFMDAVPDSAAINEAVKLAKKKKFASLSGFVNGVLRKIAGEKDSIKYPDVQDDNYLSVKYSCPQWLCEHFIKEVGLHKAEAILENSLKPRPMTIRVNLSKISKDGLSERLVKEGVTVREVGNDSALIIDNVSILSELDSFNEGLFTVQDLSSQQVIGGIDAGIIKKASLIVDVCASPGGKTCHIADRLKQESCSAKIISRDISYEKIAKIDENTERCGFDNVITQVYDALDIDEGLIGKADIVIADLPCSGLGVIGRKVDIKYRVTKDDLLKLSVLQKDILSAVSQYVKPGGMLIYSTCTIDRLENENNAGWIEEHLPFKSCQPYTKLLNDNGLTDGFFIAGFIKTDDE